MSYRYNVIIGELESVFSILRDVKELARTHPKYTIEHEQIFVEACKELREYQSRLMEILKE